MRTTTRSRKPRLAVLVSGSVSVADRTYLSGESLPTRAAMRVDEVAVVESEGAVRVAFAPRSRFSLRAGEDGEPIFHLTRGALFAQSEGKRPYAVETKDAIATPLGTSFFVSISLNARKTRYATFDGVIRLRNRSNQLDLAVRHGFQSLVARGKISRLPGPIEHPSKTVHWLPQDLRPVLPAIPRILRSFTFDAGKRAGFSAGTLRPVGALRSRGCLQAIRTESDHAIVQLKDNNVLPLDDDVWIEAMCKVTRPTTIAFRVWGTDSGKSVKVCMPLEADRWIPVAVPLATFRSSSGSRRASDLEGPCRRFEIRAGDSKGGPVDLFVDNVRFYRFN